MSKENMGEEILNPESTLVSETGEVPTAIISVEAQESHLSRDEKDPEDFLARITSRAYRFGPREKPTMRFHMLKRHFEEETGTKLEVGKVYQIKGKVEGIYDFEIFRVQSKHNVIRLHVPKEYREKLVPGKTYNVVISSIEEREIPGLDEEIRSQISRGANWRYYEERIRDIQTKQRRATTDAGQNFPSKDYPATIISRAYHLRGGTPRVRFDLWKPIFERKTGFKFQEGKHYVVKGKVEGICDFEAQHEHTSTNSHVQIEVPSVHAGRFKHGETYKILVELVAEKRTKLSAEEERLRREWNWPLVAAWIDTEGFYYANSAGGMGASICQKERKPLEGIAAFLRNEGILCGINERPCRSPRHNERTSKVYDLVTWGPEGLAKIILNTEAFIRTSNKREQIRRCKERIAAPRKRLEEKVMRARKILGL